MNRALNISKSDKISKFQLVNIALSVSAIIMPINIPKLIIYKYFMIPSVFRKIDEIHRISLWFITDYLVPTTLLFMIIAISPINKRIRTNKSIDNYLMISNAVVLIYLFVKILASQVEGGGAGYVVALYSVFTVLPALVVIAINLIRVIMLSYISDERKLTNKIEFKNIDWFVISISIILPIIYGYYFFQTNTPLLEKVKKSEIVFSQLCKDAGDNIYSIRTDATGVFLKPIWRRSYSGIENGKYKSQGYGVFGNYFLQQKLLKYIEFYDWRLGSTKVESLFRESTTVNDAYPITNMKSEYGVFGEIITNADHEEMGIHGFEWKIIDLRTDILVASSRHYTSHLQRYFCGNAPKGNYRVTNFIVRALNLKNDEW